MHEVGVVDPPAHIPKIGSGIVLGIPVRKPSDMAERIVPLASALNIFLYFVSSD